MLKSDVEKFVGKHKPPYLYNNQEFIAGKTPVYYAGPYWDSKELVAAVDTLMNGTWLTSGSKVLKFEREFSKKFRVAHSHMVNSGSSANLVLIAALKKRYNWADDSEIIVSPVGFPTTISVLYQNRLKPVFVDIELRTLNFDLNKIEEKITAKTKAIFVSPVLGNPPNFDHLLEICAKHNLLLVGDNCDSLGSKWDRKFLSQYYIAFSNSFYPAHHISVGEGGMVCSDDIFLKELFISYSTWGRSCVCVGPANLLPCGTCGNRFDKWLDTYDGIVDHRYVFSNMGYNLKPLDNSGAVGSEQLKKFDEIVQRRKISKETLTEIVTDKIPEISSVSTYLKADVSWFGTPFICNSPGLKHRLVAHLEEHKIQTRNYFAGNLLMHEGYKDLDDYKKYPLANTVLDNVFFIGAAPHYNEKIFEYIADVINKF